MYIYIYAHSIRPSTRPYIPTHIYGYMHAHIHTHTGIQPGTPSSHTYILITHTNMHAYIVAD